MATGRCQVVYRESPIIFPPSLAVLVGVDAAIILQKVEFLCSEAKTSGRMIDGERWIWNTYEQWRDDHFPFWSCKVIKDKIRWLEEAGYLLSCQPDGGMSRKKYYRVSEAFRQMATVEYAKEILQERRETEGEADHGTKLSDGRTKLSHRRTKLSVPKQRRLPKGDNPKETLLLEGPLGKVVLRGDYSAAPKNFQDFRP